jgi:hypothetical protein
MGSAGSSPEAFSQIRARAGSRPLGISPPGRESPAYRTSSAAHSRSQDTSSGRPVILRNRSPIAGQSSGDGTSGITSWWS